MKNKKKKELSDSDVDDSKHPSDQFGLNLNNSSHSKKNPTFGNPDGNITAGEVSRITSLAEPDSANESENDNPSEEINSPKHKKSPSKGKSDNINSIFSIEDLTSDDEVYFFQCPENYLKKNLCDEILDFTKLKPTVTSNGEVYTLELFNSEKKYITLAVPGKGSRGTLVNLPLKGHIMIQKDIDSVHFDLIDKNASDVCKIVFPKDIKIRHPLLGVEWKSYIESANEAIGKNYTKCHNKKLKKEKNVDSSENKNKEIKRENSESEIVYSKKKKKRS